jgi:hypothetical protein
MPIDRGNTVFFKNITFTDEDGASMVADTASITLDYPVGAGFDSADVTLTIQDDYSWEGSWDSSVSDAGVVHGSLTGASGSLVCVKDFKFKLVANRANEDAND